jgi:Tfp pilus assembly protein PilF
VALQLQGKREEAVLHYQRALEINPNDLGALVNFGSALLDAGRTEEAATQFQRALKIDPDNLAAHLNRALAMRQLDRFDEAVAHYEKALKIQPNNADAHVNLGAVLVLQGKYDEAADQFRKALEIAPAHSKARQNLDLIRSQQESIAKTLDQRREVIRAGSTNIGLLNVTAWELATSPFAAVRNGKEAVELAERAMRLFQEKEKNPDARDPAILRTLAAAQAESGKFSAAAETARQAISAAEKESKTDLAESLRMMLRLFEAGKPYRQNPSVR